MLVPPSLSSTESSSTSQGGHNCRKGHLQPLAFGRNAEPSVQPAASEHRGHPLAPAQDPPQPPTKGIISQEPSPTSHQEQLRTGFPHPNPHPRTASHRLCVTRMPPPVSGFREEIEDCFFPPFLTARGFPHEPSVF